MSNSSLNNRPLKVCIQGLGFVGSATALVVANALDHINKPVYNVVGVDLPTSEGRRRIEAINNGQFPFDTLDPNMKKAAQIAYEHGNLQATSDEAVYQDADIVLVDVQLDIKNINEQPEIDFAGFKKAISILGENLKPGALIVIETTVPPGTCEHIVCPIIEDNLNKRGLAEDSILIAHSYERVMPGKDYYNSIVNFWRVYSGLTTEAADLCEQFLSSIINTGNYPLTRLHNTTASETAKVLENSYRAMNIAFMEEWGRFAEAVGIDLFEIVDAIRVRPTHNNIRQPGFGVGGYCLTKDPLFAHLAAKDIFKNNNLDFPFSRKAVHLNRQMPLVSLNKIKQELGSLQNKHILLLGVSYRPDVADTRNAPAEEFVRTAELQGAKVDVHDPLVSFWDEMARPILNELPSPIQYGAIIFAVGHSDYKSLNLNNWLSGCNCLILDADRVLTDNQIDWLRLSNLKFKSIGRGL